MRPSREKNSPAAAAPSTLDAELVVIFQPGGWDISLALLLHRGHAMADEIEVRLGPDSYDLGAISDDLFEPITIADPAAALAGGVAAGSTGNPLVRWVRSGRSLHAFTARAGLAGFISVPRVVIGQENAVLCTDELAESVLRVCAAVGGGEHKEVSGPGVPSGWRCFRGIRPAIAVAPEDCDGALLSLVPLPDAVIDLSGGISMSRSAWLSGYPPSIRILGAAALPGEVTIDGQPASSSEACDWISAGWDTVGMHTVRYAGLARTYEICQAPVSWEGWEAHTGNGLVLCGALATGSSGHPAFASAAAPLWLIGRTPGEIVQALRGDASPFAMTVPSFDPVWAVPVHTGRGHGHHLPQLIGRAAEPGTVHAKMPRSAVRLWCEVLRGSVRNPRHWQDTAKEAAELWIQYRHVARALWRRSR